MNTPPQPIRQRALPALSRQEPFLRALQREAALNEIPPPGEMNLLEKFHEADIIWTPPPKVRRVFTPSPK